MKRPDFDSLSSANRQEFLTAREVSLRLRLPLSTVYYLAKSGELPATQFGRTWRFPAASVDKLGGRQPSPASVLVVDDDAVARMLIHGVLAARGHRVEEASDAELGLKVARAWRFDLLLIDFKLPGKDGVGLIQELRGTYSLGQMILITAFANLVDLERLSELGAVTLLRKPLDTNQLIESVERHDYPTSVGTGSQVRNAGFDGMGAALNESPDLGRTV